MGVINASTQSNLKGDILEQKVGIQNEIQGKKGGHRRQGMVQ